MRIVVDTNVVFSAMLNTDSRIARIILQPATGFNFYSTEKLLSKLEEHPGKLKDISGYSESEYKKVYNLFTRKIRFINIHLIPKQVYIKALSLTEDVDVDDTEFVALTEHIKGKFWSGDKELRRGLVSKGWDKFVFLEDLYEMLRSKK